MIIGITGSFGSGKTAVSNLFRKYGFTVINVDKLYHKHFYKNHPLKSKIKKEFGTLKRNELKEIVFNDYSKLRKLNKITHPIIIKAMKKEINKIKKHQQRKKSNIKKSNRKISNNKLRNNYNKNNVRIAVDIPLLFEAKLERSFDKIIVVKCGKKNQINRILKKKRYSKKEIENIIKSQMPLKEKAKKADFVVDNGKTIKNTERRIRKIINSLQQNP